MGVIRRDARVGADPGGANRSNTSAFVARRGRTHNASFLLNIHQMSDNQMKAWGAAHGARIISDQPASYALETTSAFQATEIHPAPVEGAEAMGSNTRPWN